MKLPARLWREVLDELLAYDDAGKLSRITAPTLLMWGIMTSFFQEKIRTVSSLRSKAPSSGSIKKLDTARTGNARNALQPTFRRFYSRVDRTPT